MKVALTSVILLCSCFLPLSLADFNQSDWKFFKSVDGQAFAPRYDAERVKNYLSIDTLAKVKLAGEKLNPNFGEEFYAESRRQGPRLFIARSGK